MLRRLLDWLFPRPSRQAGAANDRCPDCNLRPSGCRCIDASGW